MTGPRQTKILMVDDRPENLIALEAVLSTLGRTLVSVGSGEDALRRLLVEDFAVILLDVHMPGMDGFEVANYIKGLERTRRVPIIFLTAISKHPNGVFQGYESGAVDYLSKPFDPDVLRSKVGVFVELYEQRAALEALVAEQSALRRVATAIAGNQDFECVFMMVAEEIARVFDVANGVVARADGEQFAIVGAWAKPGASTGEPQAGSADVVLAAAAARGTAARGSVDGTEGTGSRQQVAAPVRLGDETWGVVAVTAATTAAFPPEAEESLERFAELLGIGLAGADAKRLALQASSDPLTGLANHRTFQERLAVEVERARRHGRSLSLALLDVDGFKEVNDTFGHQTGDRVLVDVAGRVAHTVRSSDLVARIGAHDVGQEPVGLLARVGGDEFALLLPETDAVAAQAVLERAHAEIRSASFAVECSVTISIGICDLEHAANADELIRCADGALYWAKTHGRDAVWRYSPETVGEMSAEQRVDRLTRHQAVAGLRALARAVDAKDRSTQEHSERVSNVAGLMAEAVGWPAERVALLREAALVHDVGKIGVADAILLKPDRLNAEEYALVKKHAALGAHIVSGILNEEQVAWVRSHHERYDGRGYPDGLSAEAIPDGARLLAVADAWDAMTSPRPYSPTVEPFDALAECRRQAGAQFAREAVAALETPELSRLTRMVQNEFVARTTNDRRHPGVDGVRNAGEDAKILRIVCECGDAHCSEPVEIDCEQYAATRADDRRFLIRPGHELPEVESVVSRAERFLIVEKRL